MAEIKVYYKKLPTGLLLKITEEIVSPEIIKTLKTRREQLIKDMIAEVADEKASIEKINAELALIEAAGPIGTGGI